MSHDTGWRAACGITIHIPWIHFGILSEARGVTDGGVGSGALLGIFSSESSDNFSDRLLSDLLL